MVSHCLIASILLAALCAAATPAHASDEPACAVALAPAKPGKLRVTLAERTLDLGATTNPADDLRVYPAGRTLEWYIPSECPFRDDFWLGTSRSHASRFRFPGDFDPWTRS